MQARETGFVVGERVVSECSWPAEVERLAKLELFGGGDAGSRVTN